MLIAAQVRIVSKTNGSLPVVVVTKWVVELCSYAALSNSKVECVFMCGLLFFFKKQKRSTPMVSLLFRLCLEAACGW